VATVQKALQPVLAVKAAVGLVTSAVGAYDAYQRGDYVTMVEQLGGVVNNGIGLWGSARESGNLFRAAWGGRASLAQYLLSCFVAGTPLLTPEGSKPIEEFQPGDWVLSSPEGDPEGPVTARQVLRVFVRVAPVVNLHAGGRVIRTTREHPFYVKGRGWLSAGLLEQGDLLRSHDGQWVPMEALTESGEVTTVYNLEVDEDHTYFVGDTSWAFSVWAHNAYKLTDEQKDAYARKYAEYINGNKEPDWNVIAPGESPRQIRNIRKYARAQGYVTPAPVNEEGYADFTGRYYIKDGMPLDNVPLPTDKWDLHYTNQFNYLNKEVLGLENTPTGYIWHHHQDAGRMQLVELGVHLITPHNGGREVGWSR
jgi:hypothetical protein